MKEAGDVYCPAHSRTSWPGGEGFFFCAHPHPVPFWSARGLTPDATPSDVGEGKKKRWVTRVCSSVLVSVPRWWTRISNRLIGLWTRERERPLDPLTPLRIEFESSETDFWLATLPPGRLNGRSAVRICVVSDVQVNAGCLLIRSQLACHWQGRWCVV